MARPATGAPRWSPKDRCWIARVSMPGKPGREPVPMPGIPACCSPPPTSPATCKCTNCARAVADAKVISARMRGGGGSGVVSVAASETVTEYAKRWLAAREGRISSVRDNKGHLNEHILPVIGTHEIAAITSKHIEDVVAALDAKVRASEISAKTARNVWGTCSKLFDDATHAKPAEGLRCLAADPTDGVRGPDDNDADKMLQFLYPSEFATFLACEDVPLRWRRNATIATYLCLRDGEQRALKWSAVDLEHGVVTIAETYDRRAKTDREGTKGGAARMIPIRTELVPLLAAMHEESGGKGHVCQLPSLRDMARGIRRWLKKAGIDRPQLHVTTTVNKAMRWHDLRATGLTWLAVEGRGPTEIRDIAGHTQTSMTDRYMRAAGVLRGGRFGEPFPALPEALVTGARQLGGNWSAAHYSTTNYSKLLRGGRDSKKQAKRSQTSSSDARSSEKQAASASSGAATRPTNTQRPEQERQPSIDVLRRKLDAAIVAEAWDAVKAIRGRMIEVERAPLGNVVDLGARRKGGA